MIKFFFANEGFNQNIIHAVCDPPPTHEPHIERKMRLLYFKLAWVVVWSIQSKLAREQRNELRLDVEHGDARCAGQAY